MGDELRLPADPEAGAENCVRVRATADERHVVSSREESSEETAHRSCANDDDAHRGGEILPRNQGGDAGTERAIAFCIPELL